MTLSDASNKVQTAVCDKYCGCKIEHRGKIEHLYEQKKATTFTGSCLKTN